MQVLYCDVCKKKMDNPIINRNFFYIGKYSICEPCKENLDAALKPSVRNKDPFAMDWYRKLVSDAIDKGIQKGKF